MKPITRKQAKESIESRGLEASLRIGKSGLTAKQRKFAEKIVIDGMNASDAYRAAYDTQGKANTINVNAHKLMHSTKVSNTIDALEQAKQASALHSAESLRALCVSTLVDVACNSDRDAVRVAAVRVLGSVVGVDAYRETKRIESVKPSDDIKAQIMAQLKTMMLGNDDAVTVDATDLLAELVGDDNVKTRVEPSESGDDCDSDNADRTHPVPPDFINGTPASTLHTIPLKPSPNFSNQSGSPIPLPSTPLSFENEDGGGDIFLEKGK
jgi:hypothetical protein